jgi:phage-related protein (TIGR01555 family)
MKQIKKDGFYNAITSVGTSRDKGTQNTFSASVRLRSEYIDAVYAESAIFARIVDLKPEDGLRKWIDFNHDNADEINDRLHDLQAKKHMRKAAKRERLHGGSVIFADIDDGQTPDMPLNIDRIKRINYLQVIEKDYISPANSQRGLESELFQLSSNQESMLIHRSRLAILPGIEISDDFTLNNNGWGEPVARRVLNSVQRLEMLNHVTSALSQDFIISHWGMDGLNELIDSDDEDTLKARLDAKRIGVSITNDVVTDSQDSYNKIVTNVTGIDTLRDALERDLVQVSGYPHTKILGESPGASLSGAGSSQEKDYNQVISAYQEDKLRDIIQWILNLITAEIKAERVKFTFAPLDEPDMVTLADVHLKQAQADQIYYNMGLPETAIFESRFKEAYSLHTKYDDDIESQVQQIEAQLNGNANQAPTA